MDKKLKAKWLKALRSGNYAQGQGHLCQVSSGTAKYCCLGVLAEIAEGEDHWEARDGSEGRLFSPVNHSEAFLNIGAYGITGERKAELMKRNDADGYSFDQLADYIEEHL